MPASTLPPDPFPPTLHFADVDPAALRDEAERPLLAPAAALSAGAWNAYLARLLPPLGADRPHGPGCAVALRTEEGMADFLASFGPGPAAAVARGLEVMDGSGFWCAVQRELVGLAAAHR